MSEWREKWYRVPKAARIFSMIVIGLITAACLGLVFGIFVRELWNWIMPDLFGLKTITYWQAFGIVILGHMIFGGSGGGRGESKSHHRGRRHESMCEDDAGREGSMHWKYYDEWWSSQGKQHFMDFVDKKNKGRTDKDDNEA